jgi:thymidylate kinase
VEPAPEYHFPGRLQLAAAPSNGKFIVFCGTDGAGKSTLIAAAKARLEEAHHKVREVRFPSHFIRTFVPYKQYRSIIDREHYSYRAVAMAVMADRIQVIEKDVAPGLASNEIIVSHRYVYAGLVRLYMHGVVGDRWFHEACRYLIAPHVTFLVVASPDTIAERLRARVEESNDAHLIAEAQRFQELLVELAPANNFVLIDTTEASVTASTEMILTRLAPLL